MVAFDTNVIVRLLLRDDNVQAKKAELAFLRHARGDGVFMPLVVLVETAWVLAYTYDLDRKVIHATSRLPVALDVRPKAGEGTGGERFVIGFSDPSR